VREGERLHLSSEGEVEYRPGIVFHVLIKKMYE
jgi:hypothetical protein